MNPKQIHTYSKTKEKEELLKSSRRERKTNLSSSHPAPLVLPLQPPLSAQHSSEDNFRFLLTQVSPKPPPTFSLCSDAPQHQQHS